VTPDITDADAPTIPSFVTVAEQFADEFWTSATAPNTAITLLSPTPTNPLDFATSAGCSGDSGSKLEEDLTKHQKAGTPGHINSNDVIVQSIAEKDIDASTSNVERMLGEDSVDEQINTDVPVVISDTAWGPSSTPDPTPTPESLAFAEQSTPTQGEIDAAWPAPSIGDTNAADSWGVGDTAAPDTKAGYTWGVANDAPAADAWGTETKGDTFNSGWSGGGGWKRDQDAGGRDQGFNRGGFRRNRSFWQPPESDGGWDGFRMRGGLGNGGCVGDCSPYARSLDSSC
jgi:hypothetical protein